MRHPTRSLTISLCLFLVASQSLPAGGCCAGSGTSRGPDGGERAAPTRRTAAALPDHVLAVGGMTCAQCEAPVRQGLAAVPGVARVEVTHAHGLARVWVEGPNTDLPDLVAAVQNAGFEAVAQQRTTLRLVSRPDAKQLSRLEEHLRRMRGVADGTRGSRAGSPVVAVWHASALDGAEITRVASASGARVETIAAKPPTGPSPELEGR